MAFLELVAQPSVAFGLSRTIAVLQPRPGRRRRVVLSALLALVAAFPVAAVVQDTLENDVKAAFLFNFTKFIEWPALPGPDAEPFRICVMADDRFDRAVDRIIEGETVDGRRLVRSEPQTAQDARACAMLYVGRAAGDRGVRLLGAVRDLPVLTVGDSPLFVQQGGAIQFVLENNRVRFDIGAPAVQRSGLKVSSKLLRIARTVVEGGAP
jgi:YfiR/HmsC-like